MKTIDYILEKEGYTEQYLLNCEQQGICNGMGIQGGIQWTDEVRKLKFFDSEKEKRLLYEMDLVSDIHDLKFNKGGSILDYIKANYQFGLDIIGLLQWTTLTSRIIIFTLAFGGTTLFGWSGFNLKKVF